MLFDPLGGRSAVEFDFMAGLDRVLRLNPFTGEIESQVTVCRIAGGDIIEYADDDSVPSILYPNLGSDLSGQCWYYTSTPTDYVIIVQFADGSAEVGFDTDPGVPGWHHRHRADPPSMYFRTRARHRPTG